MAVFKVPLPDGTHDIFSSQRQITHCVVGSNPHNNGKGAIYAKCGSLDLANKAKAKEVRNCPWLKDLKVIEVERLT